MSFVYFIQQAETRNIKIGIAADPIKRRMNLQVGSPQKLTIIALLDPGEIRADTLETYLHTLFVKHNIRGEWFRCSAEILDFAEYYKYNKQRRKKPIIAKLSKRLESKLKLTQPLSIFQPPLKHKLTAEEISQQEIWVAKMIVEGNATWNGHNLVWKCDDRQD